MNVRSIEVTSIVSSLLRRISPRRGRTRLVASRFGTHCCGSSEQSAGGDGLWGGGVSLTDRISRRRIGRTNRLRRSL